MAVTDAPSQRAPANIIRTRGGSGIQAMEPQTNTGRFNVCVSGLIETSVAITHLD
jgi:hypothetical protein